METKSLPSSTDQSRVSLPGDGNIALTPVTVVSLPMRDGNPSTALYGRLLAYEG